MNEETKQENIVIEEHPNLNQTWVKIGDRIVWISEGNKDKFLSLLKVDFK